MAFKRPDPRAILFERIRNSPPKFVHLVGVPYKVEADPAPASGQEDLVLLTVEVPPFGRLRIDLNTTSRTNLEAGLDARVRLRLISSVYIDKPAPVLAEEPGLDYGKITALGKDTGAYEPYEREALAELLISRARTAVRAEVWGELYAREHIGLHHVYCRRASRTRKTDFKNRDGALKLYYAEENRADFFLFKFFGQP